VAKDPKKRREKMVKTTEKIVLERIGCIPFLKIFAKIRVGMLNIAGKSLE
jgi:hypothetical protein